MPLFFICSGYVFSSSKYKTFRNFINAKLRRLVLPYFSLGISLWGLEKLLQCAQIQCHCEAVIEIKSFTDMLLSLVLGYRLHDYYFSLWFLCVLFVSEMLLYLVIRFSEKQTGRDRLIVFLITGAMAITTEWAILRSTRGCYWSIDIVPAGLTFLMLGYMLQKANKEKILRLLRLRWLMPALLLSIAFAFANFAWHGEIDLYSGDIGNPIIYVLAGLCGTWCVAICVCNCGENKLLNYFGKTSLITYAFQNDFCIPLAIMVTGMLAKQNAMLTDKIFQWVFITALTLAISSCLVEIIQRWMPWMIGKKKTQP